MWLGNMVAQQVAAQSVSAKTDYAQEAVSGMNGQILPAGLGGVGSGFVALETTYSGNTALFGVYGGWVDSGPVEQQPYNPATAASLTIAPDDARSLMMQQAQRSIIDSSSPNTAGVDARAVSYPQISVRPLLKGMPGSIGAAPGLLDGLGNVANAYWKGAIGLGDALEMGAGQIREVFHPKDAVLNAATDVSTRGVRQGGILGGAALYGGAAVGGVADVMLPNSRAEALFSVAAGNVGGELLGRAISGLDGLVTRTAYTSWLAEDASGVAGRLGTSFAETADAMAGSAADRFGFRLSMTEPASTGVGSFRSAASTGLAYTSESPGVNILELTSRQKFDAAGNIVPAMGIRSEIVSTFNPEKGSLFINFYRTTESGRGIGTEMISNSIQKFGAQNVQSISAELGLTNKSLFEYNMSVEGMSPVHAASITPLGKSPISLGYRQIEVNGYHITARLGN